MCIKCLSSGIGPHFATFKYLICYYVGTMAASDVLKFIMKFITNFYCGRLTEIITIIVDHVAGSRPKNNSCVTFTPAHCR
mmetsp:Transcript_6204/g.15084  ORF Transcript_6204/g.15084 Transcript_6204/m.15084 type:complete len:80 (-) Transcript_6204:260-499(-)